MLERTPSMRPFAPLELLSPARDLETARAAVLHGADAVYIGGPAFGARQAAGNSFEDLARIAEFAHQYRARVYMTLNTLIYDNEFDQAVDAAWKAKEAGVDALIVQDLGLLKGQLPDIEIHASTQCDIRTPEKAAFLDSLGFAQIVPARELTLDEIAAIRKAMPRARIEFFIAGALCVSYSGKCYLSAALTGRSANRGQCSQPCRLPYDVTDLSGRSIVRSKHVLSLKDNDQSANLENSSPPASQALRLKDASRAPNTSRISRHTTAAKLTPCWKNTLARTGSALLWASRLLPLSRTPRKRFDAAQRTTSSTADVPRLRHSIRLRARERPWARS